MKATSDRRRTRPLWLDVPLSRHTPPSPDAYLMTAARRDGRCIQHRNDTFCSQRRAGSTFTLYMCLIRCSLLTYFIIARYSILHEMYSHSRLFTCRTYRTIIMCSGNQAQLHNYTVFRKKHPLTFSFISS